MTQGAVDISALRVSETELRARLGERTPETEPLLEKCAASVRAAAEGRYAARSVAVTDNDGASVCLDGHRIESVALARNLSGADRAFLMAVTLGVGVDRLLRRLSQVSGAELAVADGYASALCEALCDEVSDILADGMPARPRFSPGYGDFPLCEERWLLSSLDGGRLLGIALGESMLMTPVKSVTAVMGIENRK